MHAALNRVNGGQYPDALPEQQASVEAREGKRIAALAIRLPIRHGAAAIMLLINGAYNMAYYQKQELNTSIYLHNNKYGFRYNVSHPKINELYRRYKRWQGIPSNDPLSDSQRREFEKYLDGIFLKK